MAYRLLFLLSFLPALDSACPHRDPVLHQWHPGHDQQHHVRIGYGRHLLLASSATVHSIHITNGGKLVIDEAEQPVVLRTRHILIEDGGELHVGSEDCPFQGHFTVSLYGRSDDTSAVHGYFGKKYIGVGRGGTLEIHGQKKLSWTFLNKTLHPGGLSEGGYYFEKSWGHRGVIVHSIDPGTGDVVHSDRFDTFKFKDESLRLGSYLNQVPDGMILSIAVNDEGSKYLDDTARKVITKLGSKRFQHLGFRHPWSLITVKGDPSSSVEDHVEYNGFKGSAVAKVSKLFQAENGERFNVSSVSEWIEESARLSCFYQWCALLTLLVQSLHRKPEELRAFREGTDYLGEQEGEFSANWKLKCSKHKFTEDDEEKCGDRGVHTTGSEKSKKLRTLDGDIASDVEWTDWFDSYERNRISTWEKLSELRAAHPGKICARPADIQATTIDGVTLTADVLYKSGQDYRYACRKTAQTDGDCPDYRVRFLCGRPVRPKLTVRVDTNVNSTILELADDARTWKAGDTVVVASTDYSMYQAEEFQILPCRRCAPNQVKVKGTAQYLHMGEEVDGVDMRAEVGLLSRNIVFRGEMESTCYGSNVCKFFDFDTFGGHVKLGRGFAAAHIEGVELKHMGQQTMGHYPIHFHTAGDVDEKGGYNPPTYVKDIAIHHAFSRCITIHGSNGLLVKDVVGYDTLGHCFFTEDGPEERNMFDHCLGLLVKAGTLLPSDRDSKMCRTITEDSYPGYIPKPRQDCSAVSTFWMANPNNSLVNCAAAGSEETGFWFIFHHVPTGPSEGMYSPGHSEHIPLGRFQNNRAHSNYRAGMIIDNGVKTTEANAKDKRPFLSLVGARYGPHKDADPLKPREPALIEHFIAYKNQDHGAWLRGGDVWLNDCQFADNGIGLTLASGGTFPDDDGSKQEVKNSLFVGESNNIGTETMENSVWGPGGMDHRGRTLPKAQNFPIRGLQIYDGPINIQNCTFRKFVSLIGRHTSAIGFRLNNSWQSCPNNNITNTVFQDVPISSRVFFGEPGPWFHQLDMDGDKTTIFHDLDGSVSEYPGAYLVKEDNWLLRHPDCIDVPDWRGAICSGSYAQIYIQARKPANMTLVMIKDEYPTHPLHLDGALSKSNPYQQYQPVVALGKGYTIHWDRTAPEELTIWLINFNMNDWIQLGFCYPKGTTFSILSDIHNRLTKQTYKTGIFLRTFQMDKLQYSYAGKSYYYWDEDSGLLFLKVKAQNEKEQFAFCSTKGCERIKIKALIPRSTEISNCVSRAYPKYAQIPTVDVPMPQKLHGAQLKSKDHFLELKLETYNTRFFHLKDDFAYIEVDSKRFFIAEDGIKVVVIDGNRGKVVESVTFKNSVLQGIPAQIHNYVAHIKENSIVLMVSKGRLLSKGPWTKVLEKLGAQKDVKLKDKMAFVGFKGNFRPTWSKLLTDMDAIKIFQAVAIPVVRMKEL